MAKGTSEPAKPGKFRPARAIILNESNTGLRTKVEVEHAIEQLRSRAWLVTYGAKTRPLRMCFDSSKEEAEFRKAASDVGVKLAGEEILKDQDFEDAVKLEEDASRVPGAEDTNEETETHLE